LSDWSGTGTPVSGGSGESTLSIAYGDLLSEVGHFLGYGRDATAWTQDQTDDADAAVQSGVRQFYFPPPIAAGQTPHTWSFMRPVTTLEITADDYEYDLPDAFGAILEPMTFEPDNAWEAIRIVGEAQIRSLRQTGSTATTRPKYAAIRPKAFTGAAGQRFEIIFHPTPDATYTLTYAYTALVNQLTAQYPYPLGGMAHGETILESCLAIAEERMNDGERGLHHTKFLERLAASVVRDAEAMRQEFFGYNGDASGEDTSFRPFRAARVTVGGQYYQ